ncbi:MAG: FAD-dependent oxidoreductase [Planctomycetota bacterium]|nr:FAD-dependent oxidoreductase [Planctomycetota bacterium]
MSHKIIACRVEHCLGCKSCEIACALEHSQSKDIRQAVAEHPLPQRRVTVEVAGTHGLPLQCRHCEDGLCQIVCPTGAIHHDKKRSVTVVDEDLCIGCKLCTLMCPMGVLRIGEKNRATIKCDQCIERQGEGLAPACVAACPTHALQFVDSGEVVKDECRLASVSVMASLALEDGAEKKMAKKAAKPKKGAKAKGRRVLVIGSNAAGAMAAINAAEAGAKVTLITADAMSYRRPAIPALIAGNMTDISEAQIYSPKTFKAHGVDVLAPALAVAMDTAKKTVTVKQGGKTEDLAYDAVILATGGTAARPKIAGADKKGVCTFTTVEGARQIIEAVKTAHAAVVVGASFIALEVAQALLEKGLTVYFNVRSRILRRMVEPDLSEYLQGEFAKHGLNMLTGEEISEIGGAGAVEYVVHKGRKISAQVVILGTGVSPNVQLAQGAGIKLAESGAIAVDNKMQTSAADVYAAGDCAEVPDFSTGRFGYSAVGSTGALAGAIAGVNAAGGDQKTDGFLRAQADEILGVQVYSIGHSTTTAKDVGLKVKVEDLPAPPEAVRMADAVKAKLLVDEKGRIVGAQAVAHGHGSQYAWQLYKAVLMGEAQADFVKRWMSPRRRAAAAAEKIGWGELIIKESSHV